MTGRGRRLLVVEDDALLQLMLELLLTEESWAVLQATTCAQARTVLSTEQVDVVVLDESLPDGSGLDLVAHIPAGVHVVLYSGSRVHPRPAGVHAVVDKGGPPDALAKHLATVS